MDLHTHLCVALIILSSLIMLHAPMAEGHTIHMNITNNLGDGIPLNIRCKSKDDDLGYHMLDFHSSFTWHFKPNAFFQNTLFWCFMEWKNAARQFVSGSFDVYREDRDQGRCRRRCLWSVRFDGAYAYNQGLEKYELMHAW